MLSPKFDDKSVINLKYIYQKRKKILGVAHNGGGVV